jgi:opacity protein-like surface antigen
LKKIILAVAVAAVAIMAVASAASADVARYQMATGLTVTATFNGTTYVHTYNLTNNACNGTGSFTGTGGIPSLPLSETVNGTLNDQNITIQGTYEGNYNPGYVWKYSGPLSGGNASDSMGQTVPLTFKVTMSNFKNHGDYVSSQGGGSDAAHSCIGMPIH